MGRIRRFVKFVLRIKPTVTMREITMTEAGRKLYVSKVVMEHICDGLLNAVLDGEIAADEANNEMAKMAKLYGHEEMIPLINARKTPLLKAQLRASNRRRKLNGKHPVPLPLPQPVIEQVEPGSFKDIIRRSK